MDKKKPVYIASNLHLRAKVAASSHGRKLGEFAEGAIAKAVQELERRTFPWKGGAK